MDVFKLYLPLGWFKTNPLDLPQSIKFFKFNLVFYFIVELFIQANMIDVTEAFLEVILETSLTLVFVWLVLLLSNTSHIYIQIITAVLFCENISAFFALPFLIWLTVSEFWVPYIIFGLCWLWDYSLVAYVFKKVLSINAVASMTLSLFYFIGTYGGAYSLVVLLFS